jgi:hypothetical protein
MIDFQLSLENLVRQDSTTMELAGKKYEKLRGVKIKVEYRVHRSEVRDPKDPEGKPLDLWCLYLPQIDRAYVDKSEELVLEALNEFFEEDFVHHFAQKLVDERRKDMGWEGTQVCTCNTYPHKLDCGMGYEIV